MKKLIVISFIISLSGCASYATKDSDTETSVNQQSVTLTQSAAATPCPGNTELPEVLAGKFDVVEDETLLNQSLGDPGKGRLCQGKVYQAKAGKHITVYRSWNSTNPNSKLGNWWAAQIPQGKTSQYRVDYEICYQWSPLDKMTQCTLKPSTKIVIGTGQSSYCSEYLTYPPSAEKQIYIDNAIVTVADCTSYNNEFSWRPVVE